MRANRILLGCKRPLKPGDTVELDFVVEFATFIHLVGTVAGEQEPGAFVVQLLEVCSEYREFCESLTLVER